MRLVSRVEALERTRSTGDPDVAAVLAAGGRVGLVWTSEEFRVDPAQAAPGEHIAVDLVLLVDASEERPDVTRQMRTRERFTDDDNDSGLVYNLAGERIGRVVQAPRFGLIRWIREDLEVNPASAS